VLKTTDLIKKGFNQIDVKGEINGLFLCMTVWASQRGVPGFHLQDSDTLFQKQSIVARYIRHGVKPML
jgi:hypothetical protein